MNTAEKIRLPDDCTIGYIIESVLGVPLTRSSLFHSHLENLQQVSKSEVHKQVRKLIQALFSSVKCSIIVLTQCFIFNLDYIELWNVWKQEEYHQHERGFLCWGGLIQVRQVLNTLDHIWILLLFIFAYMYKSKLYFFNLSQVQVSALSAVPRHSVVPSSGCLLRWPTSSSVVSSSLTASVSERHEGPVWYWAVWPLRLLCSGARPSVVILGCCAARL